MGINGDAMEWLIKKGGYGNFKSVWYINNAYADSTEFEIVHSEQTKKPDKEILEKEYIKIEENLIYLLKKSKLII